MGERKVAADARWGRTKDHTAPGGARLLCRALLPATGNSHVLARGYYPFFVFPVEEGLLHGVIEAKGGAAITLVIGKATHSPVLC